MNLWLRVIWLFLCTPFRDKIPAPFGLSVLKFRVWPHDIDTNLHMNNGRYLTIADLGRTDLLLRMGLAKLVLKEGLQPMLSGSAIRYRRELKPFQAFRLESCILCWRGTSFVMQHRFVVAGKDGQDLTVAIALVRGGLYDKTSRVFVEAERLARAVGYSGESPEITAEIESFLALEESLRRF
ncbi:FcbC Predicted thioesterase [Rhabdaerophilaceae bacterium]